MPGLKLSTTWSHPSAAADAPNGAPCVTALANATDPFFKPFPEQIQLGGEATRTTINAVRVKSSEEFEAAQPVAGTSSVRASEPSLVSNNRPSVLRSRRPTLMRRGSPAGKAVKIVGRCGGDLVRPHPARLLRRRRSQGRRGRERRALFLFARLPASARSLWRDRGERSRGVAAQLLRGPALRWARRCVTRPASLPGRDQYP
jgi:hypothetical protein